MTCNMNGTVKWFNLAKGFGVITLDEDPEKEVFCHVTNIEEGRTYTGFNIGDSVEFEAHEGRKGLYATDVKLIEEPENQEAAEEQ